LTKPFLSGPWSRADIGEFLRQSIIPLRLSAISAAGWPVIVSLWYLYEDGVIRCASRRHARIISLLEENPRCAFEIAGEAPPYFGIRGQGMASIDSDGHFVVGC
jgi:nitroimidazol reductase NimA-like FMN-containing flavoprotein (pyridoxamine 5'-phosphate oxidase superfamily)